MSLHKTDVAFITVSYNTLPLIRELVSFFTTTELPYTFKLVIVDNASSDGTREYLEQTPNILYVQTGENLGYGGGMNCGLAVLESRYACIMNSDLILNREALTALWYFMEQTPEAGVATPVIRCLDNRQQGFVFHASLLTAYSDKLNGIVSKYFKIKIANATSPLRVPGVLGAFFMIRRSCFEGNSLFDDDFFFFYEDTDLAHRLYLRQIPCYVLPMQSIIHLGGASTSISGGALFFEGRYRYLSKQYGQVHAERIQKLDRLRIRLKALRYRILSYVIQTERVKAKCDYYNRLVDAKGLQS